MIVLGIIIYTFAHPPPSEQFFQLYLLGPDRTASNYFPNNDANLTIGSSMTWIIGVQNQMATAQQVELRIKLGNDTLSGPNQITCIPAPLPVLNTITLDLDWNQTVEHEFRWEIVDVSMSDQQQRITLRINDRAILSPITAQNGLGFRMIIELWTLDPNSEEYRFGWQTNSEDRCVWTQLWFNVLERP